jgi:hypothetical protein
MLALPPFLSIAGELSGPHYTVVAAKENACARTGGDAIKQKEEPPC